jgi:hypothetical protein
MKGCNNKLMLSTRKVKEGVSVFPFKSCILHLLLCAL